MKKEKDKYGFMNYSKTEQGFVYDKYKNSKNLKSILGNVSYNFKYVNKSNEKGGVCNNKTKPKLESFYKTISDEDIGKGKLKNKKRCFEIEYQLRYNDKYKTNKRWFYTYEEAIMLKLVKNKKKK